MKNYELTYILAPHLTSDQVSKETAEIESFIQGNQGVIVKSEKSGAAVLAYTIKKQRSGYFAITEFQAPEEAVKSIKSHVDGAKDILRSTIVIKKPLKEMKALRRRKPTAPVSFDAVSRDEKKGEKADIQEIEKKLDELLR
jgi:ribosomal protein S6